MISRRRFLIMVGSAIAGITLSASQVEKVLASLHSTDNTKGIRYGMVIDLSKCQECTTADCVKACIKAHNIPVFTGESEESGVIWKDLAKWMMGPEDHRAKKDRIEWITITTFEKAFPEQINEFSEVRHYRVPILCNHCQDPPCVKVCPTQATFKRESDGIVMMDYHRCIGCRYCMAACPFGARSFNWRDPREGLKEINPNYPTRTKGVVEKCTFWAERLAKGEQPACVEACKYDAIVFGNINNLESEIRKILESNYTIRRKEELGTGPNIYYLI